MMATTAMQLAIDAFGPIADNAGGIAEMSELPKEVREKTDVLDAVGNTTAASGKGFAIASAALTALALFAAFVGIAGIDRIDIYKANVLAGLFVGGMIPFIFSALDRKSTRLNSSHGYISYAVFCLKKKKPGRTLDGEQESRLPKYNQTQINAVIQQVT